MPHSNLDICILNSISTSYTPNTSSRHGGTVYCQHDNIRCHLRRQTRDGNLDGLTGSCAHYSDVIVHAMASQITSLTIVYSTVYSGTDQRKHQCSASLAFLRVIHQWPVNSSHKVLVTFDDVIMTYRCLAACVTTLIVNLSRPIAIRSRAYHKIGAQCNYKSIATCCNYVATNL